MTARVDPDKVAAAVVAAQAKRRRANLDAMARVARALKKS